MLAPPRFLYCSNSHRNEEEKSVQESLFVEIRANTQPKTKENPIAAVRDVISGKSNKISCTILMTIKMAQTAYDMRDIISAFLDIGYFVDVVSYTFPNIQ